MEGRARRRGRGRFPNFGIWVSHKYVDLYWMHPLGYSHAGRGGALHFLNLYSLSDGLEFG